MFDIRIQTEPIAAASAQTANADERSGAVVVFSGQVRNDAQGSAMSHLVLEHFAEVTEAEIARIAKLAAQRWPMQSLQVIHRVGRINAGEEVVRVTTTAPHRRDAYEANAFIMDYLKTEAPFWKQECFADGSSRWVPPKDSDQDILQRWSTANAASEPAPSAAFAAPKIGALILAGGQGTRMGCVNKGLQLLNGKPLVAHIAERLQAQVEFLAISANCDLPAYEQLGYSVFTDAAHLQGKGPLAGIASAAPQLPAQLDAVLIAPCDTPFIPLDVVARLRAALFSPHSQAAAAMAVTADGPQPSVCLVKSGLLLKLFAHLQNGESLRLRAWLESAGCEAVHFDDTHAFTNINDLPTLEAAQKH